MASRTRLLLLALIIVLCLTFELSEGRRSRKRKSKGRSFVRRFRWHGHGRGSFGGRHGRFSFGPNVCSVIVPVRTRCPYRYLPCRTMIYYVRRYICCPGFQTAPRQRGCPREKYTSRLNLVQVARRLNLNTLVQLVTAAGLGGALTNPSARLTVFAPSNKAFAKVPRSTLDALRRNPTALANLLKFHVAPGKVPAESLRDNQLLSTLNPPNRLRVNIRGRTVIIQGGRVIKPNQGASNGIIHVVDSVLMPA